MKPNNGIKDVKQNHLLSDRIDFIMRNPNSSKPGRLTDLDSRGVDQPPMKQIENSLKMKLLITHSTFR